MQENIVATRTLNLADAYVLYLDYLNLDCSKKHQQSQTKTVIIRYVLPGWGFPIKTRCVSPDEVDKALKFMQKISLRKFHSALDVQSSVFDSLGDRISLASKRTYRWGLKQMLTWCGSQQWWKDSVKEPLTPKCSPHFRTGRSIEVAMPRVTNRPRLSSYFLSPQERLPALQQSLDSFQAFMVEIFWVGRQDEPIRLPTATFYIEIVIRYLGWLHHIKGLPLEQATLEKLITFAPINNVSASLSAAKQDLKLFFEYLTWLKNVRKVHPGTLIHVGKTLIMLAKYFYHNETKYPIVKKYDDIPVIHLIRDETNKLDGLAEATPGSIDISKKWLEYEQLIALVYRLKLECAHYKVNNNKRVDRAIALSYQRYLLLGLLVLVPPQRQRVLRELEVGRTLLKINKIWYIHLKPEDLKSGKREIWLRIPETLYLELEEWLNCWRAVLNPKHQFVFSSVTGTPIGKESVNSIIKCAAFRITGQCLTPHLIRNIVVTYFSRKDVTETQMKSLAQAMDQSRETQQNIYDLRSQEEKTVLASNMMLEAIADTAPFVPQTAIMPEGYNRRLKWIEPTP
jgi:hypothetical protein